MREIEFWKFFFLERGKVRQTAREMIMAHSVVASDINGDGKTDLVTTSYGSEILWWENTGNSPLNWPVHIIVDDFSQAHEVFAYDINSDGAPDILGASSGEHLISVWINDLKENNNWIRRDLSEGFGMAKSVTAGDLNGDGKPEIIGASLEYGKVTIWEDVSEDWSDFRETTLQKLREAHRVEVADINGDGLNDILATAYGGNIIAWYENTGEISDSWERHFIDTMASKGCIASASDIDNDGDLDVAATSQGSNQLNWYKNTDGSGKVWEETPIDHSMKRPWGLIITDFDNDGDQDLFAGTSHDGDRKLRFYENKLIDR